MPICADCSEVFHGLETSICCKCNLLEGKSELEKKAIREKPQCLCCGIVFSQLVDPLCKGCCNKFAKADISIPRAVLDVQGAFEQIRDYKTSLPRAQNTSLAKITAGTAQKKKLDALEKAVPGIGKGMTRIQEMKEKGKRVRMTVTLATSEGTKLTMVQVARLSYNAEEDALIYDVLGTVVEEMQECHASHFPTAAKIYRSMVKFYAAESVTKYFFIPAIRTKSGTVSDFLRYYYDQGIITKPQFESKALEVRLAVSLSELYSGPEGNPFSALSKRPSRLASGKAPSKATAVMASASSSRRRSSAWRTPVNAGPPASQFARHPPTFIEYKFRRYTVEAFGTQVTFSMLPGTEQETILVATDWKSGLSGKTPAEIYKTGFIGQGTSKNVVYARFGNEEYALGQSRDEDLSAADHAQMLQAEVRNMRVGEFVRKEFFTIALEDELFLLDFRFNIDGAILGVLEPLEVGHISASLGLPFADFLATRYLPCGAADKPIQKFTGNEDCGSPPDPNDALTFAIHAFTHFTMMYTKNNLVFCDLQGMYDREGNMVLIDPQSHSSEHDSSKRMYWDKGPKAIEHFLEHHLAVCGKNYICSKMAMQSMEFDTEDPTTPTATGYDDPQSRSPSICRSPARKRQKTVNTDSAVQMRPAPMRIGWPSPKN